MAALFLDTAGWFAAITPREAGHLKARRTYEEAAKSADRLVTTPLVVAEMHAMILRWTGVAPGQRFLDLVFESGTHTVIDVDRDLIRSAVTKWVRRFTDQSFSLCDAVSFEVMQRERITRVLTFDKHFSVAGFDRV